MPESRRRCRQRHTGRVGDGVGEGGAEHILSGGTFQTVSGGEQHNILLQMLKIHAIVWFLKEGRIWEAVGGKWRLEFGSSVFCLGKVRQTRGRSSGKSLR